MSCSFLGRRDEQIAGLTHSKRNLTAVPVVPSKIKRDKTHFVAIIAASQKSALRTELLFCPKILNRQQHAVAWPF